VNAAAEEEGEVEEEEEEEVVVVPVEASAEVVENALVAQLRLMLRVRGA
jgi:hypothetical protein